MSGLAGMGGCLSGARRARYFCVNYSDFKLLGSEPKYQKNVTLWSKPLILALSTPNICLTDIKMDKSTFKMPIGCIQGWCGVFLGFSGNF